MKKALPLFLISLLSVSCSSSIYPTNGGPGDISLTGPLVIGSITDDDGTTGGFVEITDTNGDPVNNAAVSFYDPGDPSGMAVTYSSSYSGSYPVTYNGSVTLLTMAYYLPSGTLNFAPGDPVTLKASFGGGLYQAAVTAVGDISIVKSGSNALVTWTGGGNEDIVEVFDLGTSKFKLHGPASLSSPFSAALLDGTAGDNEVSADIISLHAGNVSGGASGYSYLDASSSASNDL